MKKTVFAAIIIIVLIAISLVSGRYQNSSERGFVEDYKNIEYLIEGERTSIGNGIEYFGNELRTDLDGDGREDIAFVVTQSTGGSGTFFYVVAARSTENGHVGSDGYLLGDRVAPQAIATSPNPRHVSVIVASYADRAPGESMTAAPSVGKSAYLKLDPQSMRWAIVAPDFEGEAR